MDIENVDISQLKATEMKMSEEFVYAVRIVEALSKLNLSNNCEKNEAIIAIEKTFLEYKNKIDIKKF